MAWDISTAVAQVVIAIGALVSIWFTRKTLVAQQKRDAERDLDQKRAKLTASIGHFRQTVAEYDRSYLTISNHGTVPARDVKLYIDDNNVQELADTAPFSAFRGFATTIGPGSEAEYGFSRSHGTTSHVRLEWVDDARDETGELRSFETVLRHT